MSGLAWQSRSDAVEQRARQEVRVWVFSQLKSDVLNHNYISSTCIPGHDLPLPPCPKLEHILRRTMVITLPSKASLRKHIKQTLSTLTPAQIITQSTLAQQAIISHPRYRSAQRVGIYLSMPRGEAQTDLLVQNALQAGKSVFVPHLHKPDPTEKRKVMEMLKLESTEGLGRDAWGIPTLTEVDGRENVLEGEEDLDVIVVPGVAFDRAGNRLGHGAGFYDRFLERGWGKESLRRKPFLGACELESACRSRERC